MYFPKSGDLTLKLGLKKVHFVNASWHLPAASLDTRPTTKPRKSCSGRQGRAGLPPEAHHTAPLGPAGPRSRERQDAAGEQKGASGPRPRGAGAASGNSDGCTLFLGKGGGGGRGQWESINSPSTQSLFCIRRGVSDCWLSPVPYIAQAADWLESRRRQAAIRRLRNQRTVQSAFPPLLPNKPPPRLRAVWEPRASCEKPFLFVTAHVRVHALGRKG